MTMQEQLVNLGFSTLEANYLALGHTLESEDDWYFTDYRVTSNFSGFTLVMATLEKGVKNALWSFNEYEYEY